MTLIRQIAISLALALIESWEEKLVFEFGKDTLNRDVFVKVTVEKMRPVVKVYSETTTMYIPDPSVEIPD